LRQIDDALDLDELVVAMPSVIALVIRRRGSRRGGTVTAYARSQDVDPGHRHRQDQEHPEERREPHFLSSCHEVGIRPLPTHDRATPSNWVGDLTYSTGSTRRTSDPTRSVPARLDRGHRSKGRAPALLHEKRRRR